MTDGQEIDEASVKQAAKQAGADAAIFVRSIQVERKTVYGPSYAPAPWCGFYGPHLGASWYGFYGAPNIYHYNEYYDIAKNQVVWSGTIRPEDPGDIKTVIRRYVRTVINALDKQNLLGAPE